MTEEAAEAAAGTAAEAASAEAGSATVTFRDETAAGRPVAEFSVAGLPGRMTVRELIRLRVREEAARHGASPSGRFDGLVRPDGGEARPDGNRPRDPRELDWERRAEIAERAFLGNGFIVFAGDRQVEDLDAEVDLTSDSSLVFLRLVPLAGG
ncbi:hypothetical protein [Actinomadura sediminis]|uniref:Uncharacterized protein n=1 Tax=Actinomadura sediminis TaxID=1038904 RepID=A0ABW3ER55_9ACTN